MEHSQAENIYVVVENGEYFTKKETIVLRYSFVRYLHFVWDSISASNYPSPKFDRKDCLIAFFTNSAPSCEDSLSVELILMIFPFDIIP